MTIFEFLSDYTYRNVAIGAAVLGVLSGVLGSFAVLRKQGLMGDALSHAALPGICAAYLLSGSKSPGTLMIGAAGAGIIAMLWILLLEHRLKIHQGSALGVTLTSFFGLGIVLLTVIQKRNDANQAGLDKFLLGQSAAIQTHDVVLMSCLAIASLAVILLLFKEFKLVSFDPVLATTLGFPSHLLSYALTGLLVVAIVVGISTVGVILMSAMLVGPALIARPWSKSLSAFVVISGLAGLLAGVSGSVLSVMESDVPTGPSIVLMIAFLVALSLFASSIRKARRVIV